jgi:DNA-binding NarL/FixJ family response regulator
LCRAETTLKRELAAIREKLGVRTTLQVVVWVLRQGIVR